MIDSPLSNFATQKTFNICLHESMIDSPLSNFAT